MISNGKDKKLNKSMGTLPNVSGAFTNWFQTVTFDLITKENINYMLREVHNEISFKGVWQAMTPEMLHIKPEGQRSWSWFTLHAEPTLILDTDQVVVYCEIKYRVSQKIDHRRYGFVEYHLHEDYKRDIE